MRIPGIIPIAIHPLFWAVAGIIGWAFSGDPTVTAIWVVTIFFSVLLHEFGHALTARFFGQNASIDLVAFGGVTTRSGKRLKLWQDFIVVFNGPLAGFLLYVVLATIHHNLSPNTNPLLVYAIGNGALINLYWTILNLLPIMPLDGGQLMSIMLESIFGFRGIKISLFVSFLLGAAAGLYFFLKGGVLFGIILFMVAFDSYRGWRGTLSMTDKDRDEELQNLLTQANKRLEEGRIAEAQALISDLRSKSGSGIIYGVATEMLARILAEQHQYEQAYALLNSIRSELSEQGVRLLQHLAYRTQRWKEAVTLGKESYQNVPAIDTAVLNGLCHASLGEIDAAIGWLERAKEEGANDMKSILAHKELDAIRNHPRFQAFERDLARVYEKEEG